jgi:DNA-binding CsgD family transcriptional regulator
VNLVGVAAVDETTILRLGVSVARSVTAGDAFQRTLVDQSAHHFSAEGGAGYTFVRWDVAAPKVEVVTSVGVEYPPGQAARAFPHARANPAIAALADRGTEQPVRTSDLVRMEEFWETPAYAHFHGYVPGARYPMGAALCVSGDVLVFLGMHHSDRDFSDHEMAMLRRLQHLVAPAITLRVRLAAAVEQMARTGIVEPAASRVLTPREVDVITLAAQGLTSGAVGRRLGITERGVRKHLGAVYAKTGTNGRAAAAAWWTAHQAPDPRP